MQRRGSQKKKASVKYGVNPPKVPKRNGRPPNLENMPLSNAADAKEFLARMAKLVLSGNLDTKTA